MATTVHPRDFCIWLKGVFDITDTLTPVQVQTIKSKLNEVFVHEADKVPTPAPRPNANPLADLPSGARC